jgi:hypothetical protein
MEVVITVLLWNDQGKWIETSVRKSGFLDRNLTQNFQQKKNKFWALNHDMQWDASACVHPQFSVLRTLYSSTRSDKCSQIASCFHFQLNNGKPPVDRQNATQKSDKHCECITPCRISQRWMVICIKGWRALGWWNSWCYNILVTESKGEGDDLSWRISYLYRK